MRVELADAGPIVTQCVYCGRGLKAHEVTADHVIPRSRGGDKGYVNFAPSCSNCNNKKGPLTAKEYLAVKDDKGMLKCLVSCIMSHVDPCQEPVDNKASHLLDMTHPPIPKGTKIGHHDPR